MKYVVKTDQSVDQAASALEAAVARHNFGVLHVYDLKQTLKGKGFDLPNECRIYEVCNPAQALKVLASDMSMNMALPCRISVYQEDGKTCVGMILPTALLASLSAAGGLDEVAAFVEQETRAMIDEACQGVP
ncbi:MAG: DUF302 domain-containing protein [Gammaproteobacteria bacterium]|jgi:uncharacterized protein (DUF302 family)|nr:DUF302 domain-containing protein [Gammaproteobacteria bacterium]